MTLQVRIFRKFKNLQKVKIVVLKKVKEEKNGFIKT